ncbi:hypothetical protein D3C71_662090 [compost metagenome]
MGFRKELQRLLAAIRQIKAEARHQLHTVGVAAMALSTPPQIRPELDGSLHIRR